VNYTIASLWTSLLSFLSLTPELKIAKRVIRNLEQKKVERSARYILIESFQTPSNRLGLSLFAPSLSRFLKAKLVAFYMMPSTPSKQIKEKIRFKFSIERALGCKTFLFFGSRNSGRHLLIAKGLLGEIKNLYEFESLHYKDIVIGDLIYDVYLRRSRKPTLDLNDIALLEIISEFVQHFDSLFDKFVNDEIAGVCVSHTVYLLGLPARMAAYFKVPAFQVTGESIYRIDVENTHAYTSFKTYPELFRSLPVHTQNRGKELAKKRLEMRFAGKVGIDMHYSTQSAYQDSTMDSRVLRENSKPHILIAIHDFFDSPHSYGSNLYPDFYQWLLALAEIAKQTEYNWYIKTHPDVRGDGIAVLESFVTLHPEFELIPSTVSHHQLIQEGITCALTIFGTIAMEYPYLGKPVVNASLNNPHVRYDFSSSPKSAKEYEVILTKLDSLEAPKNVDSILEYYFMHHIYMLKSWTIVDYELYLNEVGGPSLAHSWSIFRYYVESGNSYSKEQLSEAVDSFLADGDIFFSRKHLKTNVLEELLESDYGNNFLGAGTSE